MVRVLAILLAAILAGCSLNMDAISAAPTYVPPLPPSYEAQLKGIRAAMKEERLIGSIQVSDMRMVDSGLGRYMICIVGHRGDGNGVGYYATYFENEDYKGVRPAVIYDFCEKQTYRPGD
jgi:hypothetical protein